MKEEQVYVMSITVHLIFLKSVNVKKKESTPYLEKLFKVVTTQPVDMEEICIICYEPLGENRNRCGIFSYKHKHGELTCKHKFHEKCIKEWMEKSVNKDCPICRS